jgi:hypothetical protein
MTTWPVAYQIPKIGKAAFEKCKPHELWNYPLKYTYGYILLMSNDPNAYHDLEKYYGNISGDFGE